MTSVARRQEHDDSGEYSDASQDIDHNNSGNDGGQHESDYDSQGSESDHSERDPDNQEAERRVDDDEDRSNPQYIPKRGTFYEHDDRTAASGEESSNTTSETASEKKEGSEVGTERRRPPRKSDIINKWSHDKYNENEQMPKSRDELVAIYGYDIRNEDAPPHARRNRRYGRGPNKYTRTWEDEEAYRRQNAIQPQPRKPPNPEDFPELDASKKYSKKTRAPRPRSKSQPASNESSENGSTLRRNASIKTTKPKVERPKPPTERPQRIVTKPVNSPRPQPKEKLPAIENLTITASVFNNSQGQPQRKVNATVAQQRPVPTDQGKKKPTPQQPQQLNNAAPNKSPPLQQATQQLPQQKPQLQQNNTQASAAGAESRGGSKRYSSLRQRPLAESYSPQPQQTPQQQQQPPQQQPQQQQIRYNEYPAGNPPPPTSQHQGSPVPQIHPQQLIHQVHRTTHGPSPPHQQLPQQQIAQQQIPPQQLPQQQIPQQQLPQQQLPQQHSQQVRLGILEQQQLVSHPHHSLHNIPQPHAMGQLQPAQGYAPPAMMPAQYMQPAAQSGSGGVFGGAMFAQPPQPYPHQIYPHHNYLSSKPSGAPLTVDPRLSATLNLNHHFDATQAGGVTYYSCTEQEQLPRPQRRPTAAIPIVRPAATDRPANSTEKDNIDRIVENMFVRKPWPATHVGDSKDKQENRSSQEPQSKEASISDSLTSSSISTDSKPSENKEDKMEDTKEEDRKHEKEIKESEPLTNQDSIGTDA